MFQGPFIELPYLPGFLVDYIVFALLLGEGGKGKKTMAYVRKHEEIGMNQSGWKVGAVIQIPARRVEVETKLNFL